MVNTFPSLYYLLSQGATPPYLRYVYKHFLLIVDNIGCQNEMLLNFRHRNTSDGYYDMHSLYLFFTNKVNYKEGLINRIMTWSHDHHRERYEYVNALLLEHLLDSIFVDYDALSSFSLSFTIDSSNPLYKTKLSTSVFEAGKILLKAKEYTKLNYRNIIQMIKDKISPSLILLEIIKNLK